MDRRDFIRRSSMATGGLLLHDGISGALSGTDKINVGIIGCGDRGKGLIYVMNQMPEKFAVTALCEVLDFRLKEAKEFCKSPVKEYEDYRKLLDDKNIHAVVIATPLHLHFDMAADSLKSGKHVYLEKTMTYSIPQAIELVKISKSFPDLVLQVGHQTRYLPLYRKVKDMIGKGQLGKVTQIDCRYDRNGSWRRPVPDPSLERAINWRMYKEYSGGLVAELLSHQMDFIHWAFDTHPDEVFSTGGIDFYKDGRETYDNVQVMLRYNKSEMVGNFGSMCANSRDGFIFRIKGNKGTVELLFDDGLYYPEPETKKELMMVDAVSSATKIQWTKGGGIPIMTEPMKDSTWYAVDEFHTCIQQGSIPLSNVVTGGTTAVCVHLANEALYNRNRQEWKPEYNFQFF